METGKIYKVTNALNGKVYIGQTIQTLSERKRQHYKFAKMKLNYKFPNALNKYTKDTFTWEIIEDNIPIENLNVKEIEYISFYNSFEMGYNSNPGGYSRFKRKATKSVLDNIKSVYNTKTFQVVVMNAYEFIERFAIKNSDISNIYCLFIGKYLRYKDWILLDNLIEYTIFVYNNKMITSDRFKDSAIREFKNVETGEVFKGTRIDFINTYNLSKGMVSQLINNKRLIYKKWKKIM